MNLGVVATSTIHLLTTNVIIRLVNTVLSIGLHPKYSETYDQYGGLRNIYVMWATICEYLQPYYASVTVFTFDLISLLLQLCPHILHYGRVDSTANSLKFCVSRPCRQGEQCYLSYGCFSSSHLINFYGFLPKGDNPYDIIPLGMHFTLMSLALNDQFFILLLEEEGTLGDCSVYNFWA